LEKLLIYICPQNNYSNKKGQSWVSLHAKFAFVSFELLGF